VPAR
jgi:hypothetical protein